MNFELINPSDPYTLVAENFEAAVIASLIVAPSGMAPVRQLGEEFERLEDPEQSPFFGFVEHMDDWWIARFGHPVEEGVRVQRDAWLAALESFMIGSAVDRRWMERVLAAIEDPADRKRAAEAWHNERRTSLNDFGGYARGLAAQIREKLKEDPDFQPIRVGSRA